MNHSTSTRKKHLFRKAMVALTLAVAILAIAATAQAVGNCSFTAATPAAGGAVLARPLWLTVNADDSAPIIAATMTVNGVPVTANIQRPVGHFVYDEEQESDIWVVDDMTVARIQSYNPGNRVVVGVNTVVATVTSASGTSTHSWTFNFGSATTVNSVSPASGAVLPTAPGSCSVSLTSPSTSFTSTTLCDGILMPTTFAPATKTFTCTTANMSPGLHTVVFSARDVNGGTVSKTWSFEVRPPMSTAYDCESCHATFPDTHPVANCASCHDHAYTVSGGSHGNETPTAAGCSGDGGGQQDDACHGLDHASDTQFGIWGSGPFTCAECHNAAYPSVPRHTDSALTVSHTTTATGCFGTSCHVKSLLAEHAKYPTAAALKYQCDLCHGADARQPVKDAVAGNSLACTSCHVGFHAE